MKRIKILKGSKSYKDQNLKRIKILKGSKSLAKQVEKMRHYAECSSLAGEIKLRQTFPTRHIDSTIDSDHFQNEIHFSQFVFEFISFQKNFFYSFFQKSFCSKIFVQKFISKFFSPLYRNFWIFSKNFRFFVISSKTANWK